MRASWRVGCVLSMILAAAGTAAAQDPATPPAEPTAAEPTAEQTMSGRVVDALTGAPVAGATVSVAGSAARTTTRPDGTYTLTGVPAGTTEVTIRAPRYQATSSSAGDAVLVPTGADAGTEVIDIMVTTGSRAPEKLLDAPVTIEKISAEDLKTQGGTSYLSALSNVKGIDFNTTGVNEQRISARGFTTQFNSRMLSMLDGHLAQLPGSGLPLGNLLPSPALDVKAVEVVVGPASALYGANAHTGVVNVMTKSPWDEKGLSLAVRGGTQDLLAGTARAAGTIRDRFGWKLNGEYLRATDFEPDRASAAHYYGTSVFEGDLVDDYSISSLKLDGSAYYQGDDLKAKGTYGFSLTDGFSATNVGRNELRGWQVHYQNLQVSGNRWFAQVTRTASDAGDTYQLNRLATMVDMMGGAPGTMELDALKEQIKLVDASQMLDSEAQYRTHFWRVDAVAGVQHRLYLPSSDGTYLDDADEQIMANEVGGYLQLELPIVQDQLSLVGAGRVDHHSDYATQLSPKAALVYSISPMHKLRAGYNRAFKSPTILENYLLINNVLLGNRTGFEIRDAGGDVVAEIDPLKPEEVSSVEVGYKGVVAERLLIDAVAYNSWYQNFISPLTQVANPADMMNPTFAFYPDGTPVAEGTPAEGTLFTYANFGKALVRGVDVGFDYLATDWLTLTSSVSYIDLVRFSSGSSGQSDLLLNVPDLKVKGSFTVKDLGLKDSFVRLGGRWEDSYRFRSGYWDSERLLPESGGKIPARFILDASAGYQFSNGLSLAANVQNALDNGEVENLGAPVPHRFAYLQLGYSL